MQDSHTSTYRVLIVSQTFPPAKGIGGRRWAKFAKYLKKAGCEIEVISASLPKSKEEQWLDDVKEITQFNYKHRYPSILSKNPRHIILKGAYRYALMRCNSKTKGTPYDRAIFDEAVFSELFLKRMEAFKPQVVIVTGPPFDLIYYGTKMRNKFPETHFIADFRDPWLDGDIYGYGDLSKKRLTEEKRKEKAVVEAYDKIVSPWEMVVKGVASRHPSHPSKMDVLHHGWDKDDILVGTKPNSGPDFIYGGNLYTGFEGVLAFLARKSNETQLKTEIYTSSYVPSDVLGKPGNFQIHKALPVKEFFKRVRQSDKLILLIPKGLANGFPTKLLEFAATGKKILAIGYPGSLGNLIEEKGLGVFLNLHHLQDFDDAVKALSKVNPDRRWIQSFEMETVTEELLKIVSELNSTIRA